MHRYYVGNRKHIIHSLHFQKSWIRSSYKLHINKLSILLHLNICASKKKKKKPWELSFLYFRWFGNFPELDRVFKTVIETIMRESLIPSILHFVCVPVFPTATLPVLVNPSRTIVLLAPSSVPPFSMLAFPPGLPLLDTMTI